MHDSAITLLDPKGQILFACSLERLTRIKQDGRPPSALMEGLDWSRIAGIAVSTNKELIPGEIKPSLIHPAPLPAPEAPFQLEHDQPFHQFLDSLPAPKYYFSHHLSHLASSYYLSGFKDAMGLIYDAGTYNDYHLGGLYHCEGNNLTAIDEFRAERCAKMTLLYALVTALAGFSPSRHEGKITGLASFGKPTKKCEAFLQSLISDRYIETLCCFEWAYRYSADIAPIFVTPGYFINHLKEEAKAFTREELAATVQKMAEDHVIEILNNAKKQGMITSDSICLSGGLFANVKINQRVKEWGFKNVFISPPMTDDGTSLGAALLLCRQLGGLQAPYRVDHMFHGINSSASDTLATLKQFNVTYTQPSNPAEEIAQALHNDLSVAVVQGKCEFGPRALGNRSVLAAAKDPNINQILNKKFHRTEFMPFAPMTLWEDAQQCYKNITGAEHTAEFMTMTFNCTDYLKKLCPAVVHVDGTARPQLIRKEVHPFIHQVISRYKELSGRPAIINTSYNMHEEPIIGNSVDAIKGFLESGIDMLYIEGYLIKRQDNWRPAAEYLQSQVSAPTQKEARASALYRLFEERATPQWLIKQRAAKAAAADAAKDAKKSTGNLFSFFKK